MGEQFVGDYRRAAAQAKACQRDKAVAGGDEEGCYGGEEVQKQCAEVFLHQQYAAADGEESQRGNRLYETWTV